MSTQATGQDDDVAIDLEVLGRLLEADGFEFEAPYSATRVGRGQSNLTYLVRDSSGRQLIVRRPPRGRLLASAHDVLREFRIFSALQGTAVPVPRTIAEYVDVALADTAVVVMEHVDGLVIDRSDVAETTDHVLRNALGPSLARTLAKIHDIDIDDVGLSALASHSSYAQRQLRRWSTQWEASRTRDLRDLDRLTELLRSSVPEQEEVRLVHGDFHIRNVIVDDNSGAVRAVLDWELSTLGDPLADLGTMLAYWPGPADAETGLFAPTRLPGFASRDQVIQLYVEASGRDASDLVFWHVLGLWKVAVIGEGVLRRAIDEPRNAAEGGAPEPEFVERLVDQAWAVASAGNLGR